MAAPLHFRLNKLSKNTTMQVNVAYTVELTRQFQFRLWLATRLIVLAARILNCRIEIITEGTTQ